MAPFLRFIASGAMGVAVALGAGGSLADVLIIGLTFGIVGILASRHNT